MGQLCYLTHGLQERREACSARSVRIERPVVDRELQPQRTRMPDARDQHPASSSSPHATGLGGIRGWNDGGIEHVGVDVNPEPVHVSAGEPLERGVRDARRPALAHRRVVEVQQP